MPWTTTGADLATMVTGGSALTAVIVWGRSQVDRWNHQRLERARRTWNGYIDINGLHTWGVRRVEPAATDPPERVTVDVINADGTPNVQMANGMRIAIEADHFLSRIPSSEQYEFLMQLKRQRPHGYPVV